MYRAGADTTDSKIVFDEKGVCDHCNTFYKDILPNWHTDEKGKRELDQILQKIKAFGKGKDFDCMVIEALPKNDTIKNETGYGRKVGYLVKVNEKSFLTLKLDYYDENLKKLKELTLISFLTGKNVKGETVFFTSSIELKNVQRGTRTILELKNLKFEGDADVRSDIFTEQYLTQKWW